MYLVQPLQTYLDDLASAQSTPGGGSASALTGALAASLASMVARLTVGKAEYVAVQAEIETLIQWTEALRLRFQQLMQEDIEAYGRLSACFKMPRSTPEEKAARSAAIQEKLVEAALVPLTVAECAAELATHCQRIAEIGNATVLSDIGVSAILANSAGNGASWMVQVNLKAMKDAERAQELATRLEAALAHLSERMQHTSKIVERRA